MARDLDPLKARPLDIPSYKIVIVGNEGVGKTSLMWRYVHQEFVDADMSTIRVDIEKKLVTINSRQGDKTIQLEIWDTVGKRPKPAQHSSLFFCIPSISS